MKIFLLLATAAAMCFPLFADDQPQPPSQPGITINVPSLTHPPTEAAAPDPSGTAVDVEPVKQAAGGPLQIKVNDNINFKFGVLLQPQADFSEDTSGHTVQNLLLRRTRFIVGGQVAKNVFFFYQTENSRLGNSSGATATSKGIASGFQTIDAVAEWRISKPFNIWAGLIYLPTSREALKSSASEFMLDVNSYAYTATTALQGTGGRDTGVMARGYFMGDRLEYRAGLFSGLRATGARNPYRMIGRLQYNFFDTEVYNLPSYAGNNFGTKKILNVGVADDKQSNYNGPTADLFADIPTSFGSSVTTLTWMHLSGGTFVPSLGKSKIYVADEGIYLKGFRLGPWVRYERRSFAAPKTGSSEKRWVVGLNWYPYLNNFNFKAGIGELRPAVGRSQKQATLQLQFFYF